MAVTWDSLHRAFKTPPGNSACICLSYEPVAQKLYFPYTEDFTFSTQQDFFQPVKQFFGWLDQTVAATKSVGAELLNLVKGAQKAAGVQFYSKDYYAQAWQGAMPSTFSIELKFNIGMLSYDNGGSPWDGLVEVVQPIKAIIAKTVPSDSGILVSPAPNAIGAFLSFGKSYVDAAIAALTASGSTGGIANATGNNASTWSLQFGAGNNWYLTMKDLIVKSANFTFSNKLDTNGNPITGSLVLNFETQSVLTRGDSILS